MEMENEKVNKKPHPKLTDSKLKEIKEILQAKINDARGR